MCLLFHFSDVSCWCESPDSSCLLCSFTRTASSSSSRTTKIRWSRPARRRQTVASSRETTLSTESPPRPQRRRTSGSTASSEPRLNSVSVMMMMIFWKSCYLTLLYRPPAELLSAKTRSMRCWLLGRRRSHPWRDCRGLNLDTSFDSEQLTACGPDCLDLPQRM